MSKVLLILVIVLNRINESIISLIKINAIFQIYLKSNNKTILLNKLQQNFMEFYFHDARWMIICVLIYGQSESVDKLI